MVAKRITTVGVEVLQENADPQVSITTVGVEVLVEDYVDRHITTVGVEVLVEDYVDRHITTVGVEVLVEREPEHPVQPQTIIEIMWDGEAWTDETARCLMPDMVTYDYGLLGMGGSMAALGEAPVAQMRCVLANVEGRYSQDRAGSQANLSGGLFQKPIRFNAGYADTEEMGLATIWEGRIQSTPEDERAATVSLTCYGYDHDIQQQRPEITTLEEQRTDELVESLADEIGYTETDLDRGYTVVPLFYADGDDGLAKMREIAEAEGAVAWVDPQDATLKLWSWAHWIGAATADTWDRGDAENVRPWRDTANAYDLVNVTYQPRRKGRLLTIHSLTKPIVIPPSPTEEGVSVTERLRFRFPLHTLYEYTTRARSAGGENLDAYLSITPAVPQGSMYWEVTLTNTHPRHALVVDKFDVIGWPIEGLSNREYRADRETLTVARRTDVRPEVRRNEVRARYALQLLAQARLVAELKSWRLQEPPLVLVIGPVPGDPRRHVGDVVSLDLADGISTISKRVVLLHRSGRYGGPEESCRWEETWTAAALDDLYQYPDPSVDEGDGAFVINTSRLSYGRLGY